MTQRRLLLIDAIGASITALMTACVLAPEWINTGLPPKILYALAFIAAGYACIGAAALRWSADLLRPLRLLARLNTIYCLGTIALCFIFHSFVTRLGIAYFSFEIVIVMSLVWWEWKLSTSGVSASETAV